MAYLAIGSVMVVVVTVVLVIRSHRKDLIDTLNE
jgi:hypothetical protein